MKFAQLIKYDVRIFFFRNHADAGRLVPDIFCFLIKLYMK